ncbi:3-oxoacyl-[acyl-carrier-protein] reductase FabG [compost metagenome]
MPTYERLRDAALARNPLPRLGKPEDIADAIVYLASERAGYITGETLHVTGGRYSS